MVQARPMPICKNNFLGQWSKKSIVKKMASIRLQYWIYYVPVMNWKTFLQYTFLKKNGFTNSNVSHCCIPATHIYNVTSTQCLHACEHVGGSQHYRALICQNKQAKRARTKPPYHWTLSLAQGKRNAPWVSKCICTLQFNNYSSAEVHSVIHK